MIYIIDSVFKLDKVHIPSFGNPNRPKFYINALRR